jgi:hypothetical protein
MLFAAITGTGLAVFVTERSAESATCTLAEAVLLAQFGSLALHETESVCVIVDPEATFAFTVTTNVKFAVVTPMVEMVQVRLRRVQVHPAGPESDCATVFNGVVSVNVTVFAVAGPPLVRVWV